MAATYDASLGSDRDWVRFLTGDRGPTFIFSDEELDAVIADTANKYFAAADVLDSMRTRWLNKGIKSKSVEGLSITYAGPEDMLKRVTSLRVKGAQALAGRPKNFRVLVP